MKHFFLPFRYAFFVTFLVCNAIIASVAVWNLGIAQSINRSMAVDVYLTCVSALGLAVYFVVTMLELLRKNVISGCVWFECTWVGIFLVLEFAGAIGMSVVAPSIMCDSRLDTVVRSACTSTRTVLVFSWTCTLLMLCYFILLITLTIRRSKHDPSVWRANVHRYDWQGSSIQVHSVPVTPTFFGRKVTPLSKSSAPPRRSAPPRQLSLRTDLSAPPVAASRPMQQLSKVPAAAPTLYVKHVNDHVRPSPSVPVPPAPSPPPLGSWPNANAINEPVRKKRRDAPPVPQAVGQRSRTPSPDVTPQPLQPPRRTPPSSRAVSTITSTSRPGTHESGVSVASRNKASGDWRSRVVVPPPLDLSKISTNRSISRR